jgi:hypothetical protein
MKFNTMKSLSSTPSHLTKTTLPCTSFFPKEPQLSLVKNNGIDIRPRKIYHPTIINACLALFKKHPDLLAQDEILEFYNYRSWRKEMGEPLESNVIYLPIGGLRRCNICENLT